MSCDRRHNLPVFCTRPPCRTEPGLKHVQRTNSTAFVMMSSDFVPMVKEKSGLLSLLRHP